MGYETELLFLRNRVLELERQVEQLRVSRRVLMNLVEKLEKERNASLHELEKENRRLQLNNRRYARWLMNNNLRFIELAAKNISGEDQ